MFAGEPSETILERRRQPLKEDRVEAMELFFRVVVSPFGHYLELWETEKLPRQMMSL